MSYGLNIETNDRNFSAIFNIPKVTKVNRLKKSKKKLISYLLKKLEENITMKDRLISSNYLSFDDRLKLKDIEIEINKLKNIIKSHG